MLLMRTLSAAATDVLAVANAAVGGAGLANGAKLGRPEGGSTLRWQTSSSGHTHCAVLFHPQFQSFSSRLMPAAQLLPVGGSMGTKRRLVRKVL